MNLEKIEYYISKYKAYLKSEEVDYKEVYKWECLKNFKDNWNEERKDIQAMYESSLKSQYSGFLWGGRRNSPRSAMIEMMEHNSDFIRDMFRDLFNEKREVLLRMDRFAFHCDQVMAEIRKRRPKVQPHYHDRFKILSVYLSFNFPEEYCIFDYKEFKKFAELIEIRELPQEFEVVRFYKITKTLSKFILKDEELLELHAAKISGSEFYKDAAPMLMVHDLYYLAGTKKLDNINLD